MSTCNIKIYRTQLTPSRNALVDKLERYLDNLTPIYSNPSFQYQQLGLDLTIKVNVSQSKITESSIGNYVRIEQDGRIWYYFILGATWKGKKVVQLALSIDSINTFRNDLHWTDRTTIMRQHGDRFYKQYNGEFIKRIDPEGENIAAEKYLVSSSNVKDETINSELKWYLVYRTRDLTVEDYANPIQCYLCAEQELLIQPQSSATFDLNPNALIAGNYYYFNALDNPGGKVIINGATYELGKTYQVAINLATIDTFANRILNGIVITKDGNNIRWAFQWDLPVSATIGSESSQTTLTTAPGRLNPDYPNRINAIRAINFTTPLSDSTVSSIQIQIGNFWRYSGTFYMVAEQSYTYITDKYYTTAGQPAWVLNPISAVDRTDSRLMKIIELPYAPCEVVKIGDTYSFPEEWVFDSGFMRLENLNTDFSNYIGRMELSQLAASAIIPNHNNDREAPKDQKDIRRESKLFHSDFYTYKAVYDSFAKEIQLEKIKPFLERGLYDTSEVYIPIYFKPTNTINSKMAFKFDTEHLNNYADFAKYEHNEDYENYLIVARNNEVPIYSNDYVNYIRTGYNYDLKAQELAKKQAITNMAIEGLSSAASFGLGAVGIKRKTMNVARQMFQEEWGHTAGELMEVDPSMYKTEAEAIGKNIMREAKNQAGGSSPFLTAQGISTGTGFIKSMFNLYYSQAQATNEREAKMASLAAQSTAVAGSDDIDLLNYYNGNKLQRFIYNTKDYQKEAIADLFHYCGYSYPHMDYPDTTSRLWFNFIQCEPFFREEPYTPFNNYIEDIKTRYATGVTVYHCNDGIWDWDQEYENWEVLVYPELSYVSNDSVAGMKATELPGGRYQISFDYIGRQPLSGSNAVVVEMLNMFDEVILTRDVAASTGEHKTITTGDFYEAPTKLRYKITYQDKETEWQTIVLAGG